jgi:sugar lactone lactonase YvrE
MADQEAELRIDCRNILGEMPLWCAQTDTLYWIDVVKRGRIFYWRTATGQVDFWDFDDLVTGVDLISGGGLLVRGRTEIFRFDPATGRTTPVFSLPRSETKMRFNDGHCDRAGRLWVGTMENNISEEGEALSISRNCGQIWAISRDSATATDARLGCPNAMCWSPDGGTFYVADSCDGWLYRYRFDDAAGTISDRKPFCRLEDLSIPDGAAVDSEGYLWNARWGAGVIARIAPDGRLDRLLRVPASQPTACCFGGQDLRTLFVTSARFGLPEDKLRAEPYAGGVFAIPVEVAGLELATFRGDQDAGVRSTMVPGQ